MSAVPFAHPPHLAADKLAFLLRFYQTSDQPTAIDDYLAFLDPDVEFVMGLNAVRGHAAVRKIRENMWGGVATREHRPAAVFTAGGAGDSELMLHGTVSYGLRNGTRVESVGWAALVVFADGDELKIKRYQVWLDGAPLSKALAEQAAQEQQGK
ncbi:hypothetical protein JCM10450v2_003415 [Rhodotorula kratochvilovae]